MFKWYHFGFKLNHIQGVRDISLELSDVTMDLSDITL